jgi:signal transduction histidine kinase
VQAATVLLPDKESVLHVMVSEGHSEHYDTNLALSPDNTSSSAVQALREGQPVQKLLDSGEASLSYDEGFRAVLAVPIIGRHAVTVVLLVHRTEPHPFDQTEINLLLTFANYATLAWEHAVLYERSDERLRLVANENERLYRQASQEKQKLAAIMGSMNDGLLLTSVEGTILYANQGVTLISDIPCKDLEGQPVKVLFSILQEGAKSSQEGERPLDWAEKKETTEFILDVKRQQGHQAIHFRWFKVGDETGRTLGRGLLLRDITKERDLDDFKTTLLGAVGHELRTPLSVIKGHASTLLQEDVTWSVEDQRYSLQKISAEADRLARLVSNLLDLSRQEAGLLLLNCEPFSLLQVVVSTLERIESNTADSHITVNVAESLPPVNIDRARIEVVLHNLVMNAIAYGEGEVRIEAWQDKEAVIVSVWDNGAGIASEELPHIFERFYRARQGRYKYAGGTGLGLAICKAFVEAHRSAIWAESASGQGTTIFFSLPITAGVKADGSRVVVPPGSLGRESR